MVAGRRGDGEQDRVQSGLRDGSLKSCSEMGPREKSFLSDSLKRNIQVMLKRMNRTCRPLTWQKIGITRREPGELHDGFL